MGRLHDAVHRVRHPGRRPVDPKRPRPKTGTEEGDVKPDASPANLFTGIGGGSGKIERAGSGPRLVGADTVELGEAVHVERGKTQMRVGGGPAVGAIGHVELGADALAMMVAIVGLEHGGGLLSRRGSIPL